MEGAAGTSGEGGVAAGGKSNETGQAGAGGIAGGSSAPRCPTDAPEPRAGEVLEGDLFIASAEDALAAEKYSEITGTVRVSEAFSGVLYLPDLVRVDGDVMLEAALDEQTVHWPLVTELRLPNLTRIGGQLYIYLTDALVETDFRSLETVGDRVYYMRNLALTRVGLDSLQYGSVAIQASPMLAACEIEAICAQVGATHCGSEYSQQDCTCETACGRISSKC